MLTIRIAPGGGSKRSTWFGIRAGLVVAVVEDVLVEVTGLEPELDTGEVRPVGSPAGAPVVAVLGVEATTGVGDLAPHPRHLG